MPTAARTLTLNVRPQTGKRRLPLPAGEPKDAKPAYEQVQADDSLVNVSGMNLRLFARPNLFRYTDPQQDELLKRWDSLPAASQTFVYFEFRSRPDRVEMWINGCYAGVFPAAGGLQQIRVSLPAGAAIRDQASYQLPTVEDKYCALDISRIAKPGAMRESWVTWPAGADRGPTKPKALYRVEGIPLIVADGPGNGDVGVVREMKGSWALECDEHLAPRRSTGCRRRSISPCPRPTITRRTCSVPPSPIRARTPC